MRLPAGRVITPDPSVEPPGIEPGSATFQLKTHPRACPTIDFAGKVGGPLTHSGSCCSSRPRLPLLPSFFYVGPAHVVTPRGYLSSYPSTAAVKPRRTVRCRWQLHFAHVGQGGNEPRLHASSSFPPRRSLSAPGAGEGGVPRPGGSLPRHSVALPSIVAGRGYTPLRTSSTGER